MKDKLMRSRYDKMIAGVCGGIGAYFDLDPTLVRLVMVLGAFTGITPFLYPVLWLLMPVQAAGSAPPQQQFGQNQDLWTPPSSYDPRVQQQQQQPVQSPRQSTTQKRYRFDPYTGQPLYSDESVPQAQTGPTIQIDQQHINDAAFTPPSYKSTPQTTRNNPKILGMILVVFGLMVFVQQIGIEEIVGPLLFIGFGIFLLLRHKRGA